MRRVDFQPHRALSLKNLVELLAGLGDGRGAGWEVVVVSGFSLVILVTQFYQFTQEFSRSDESILTNYRLALFRAPHPQIRIPVN